MIAKRSFRCVDADYFQFHLKDATAESSLADAWTTEALARNLAVAPFIVGVGTQRNTYVWLDVEIYQTEPPLDKKRWRQIIECSLEIPSGHLIITSPTLEESAQEHIFLDSGWNRLRVHYSDSQKRGVHRYKIALWSKQKEDVKVLDNSKTFVNM